MLEPHRLAAWTVFIALWAGISYHDLKHQKIPNRAIALSLIPALVLGMLDFARGGDGIMAVLPAAGLILAVALWQLEVWPAGDAKLFTLLAFYLPLLMPGRMPVAKLGIVWLANIFVPAAAALLAQSLWEAARGGRRFEAEPLLGHLRRRLIPKLEGVEEVLFSLLFLLLSCGLASLLYHQASARWGSSGLWSASFFLFAMGGCARRFFWHRSNRWAALGGGFALWAVLRTWRPAELAAFSWPGLSAIVQGALLMHLFTALVFDALERLETVRILPADLKSRMVLSEAFVSVLKSSTVPAPVGRLYRDGLTLEQVRLVQSLCRERSIPEVSVYRCHAFAFWLFIGTALTALLQQDLITSLRRAL